MHTIQIHLIATADLMILTHIAWLISNEKIKYKVHYKIKAINDYK